jgi:hypothetical protein
MEPLAAFQVLVIAMAGAMAVEAVKPDQKRKGLFWAAFAVLAFVGIMTNSMAAAWPAASKVMVWIGSSPITFLIVFLGWVAYLQKPWRRASGNVLGSDDTAFAPSNDEDVRKLTRSMSELTKIIPKLIEDGETLKERVVVLDAKYAGELAGAKAATEHLRGEWIATRSLDADALNGSFENVYLALEAIHDRQRLTTIEAQLNLNVAALLVQDDTPNYDEVSWKQWEDQEDRWRTNVELWCERAAKYLPNVREQVFATPERSYRGGGWPSDNLFGDSIRVHAYKTFLIIWRNLGDLRGEIARRVHLAAFERQAMQMRSGEIA